LWGYLARGPYDPFFTVSNYLYSSVIGRNRYCRICTLASPPGVCSCSRFIGEGDRKDKNLMVTQDARLFRQVRTLDLCSELY
jgi:hypothetical protein